MLLSWKLAKDSPDGGTDIAALVRRALAEVCTVPVLVVIAGKITICCSSQVEEENVMSLFSPSLVSYTFVQS